MKLKEKQLWKALKAFSPDEPEAVLSFSQRLAQENGWTADYTKRAIEEYKCFLFLCCVSSTKLTPSPVVDQVWHLHMVYTHSYWNELCRTILQKELHHNPTQGGAAEAQKYRECYEQTLKQYRLKFGKDAPPDIWPDVKTRFAGENFRWVDLGKYLVLPKQRIIDFTRIGIVVVIGGIGFAITQGHLAVEWIVLIGGLVASLVFIDRLGTPGGSGVEIGGCSGGCSNSGDSGCSADSGCSSGCSGCGGGCSGCSS